MMHFFVLFLPLLPIGFTVKNSHYKQMWIVKRVENFGISNSQIDHTTTKIHCLYHLRARSYKQIQMKARAQILQLYIGKCRLSLNETFPSMVIKFNVQPNNLYTVQIIIILSLLAYYDILFQNMPSIGQVLVSFMCLYRQIPDVLAQGR